MRRLLATSVLLAACTGNAAAPEVAATATDVVVDDRDQYALLHDIENALGNGLARDASALTAVQHAWQGHRFEWEAAMVPLFCTDAARCFVAPFDHARFPDRRIRQGWMPRLALDDAGFAALQAACTGTPTCVVRFAGIMQRFVFDVEQPTSVEFGDLEILGARPATATESWLATKSRTRA